jgi:hypothetical protein
LIKWATLKWTKFKIKYIWYANIWWCGGGIGGFVVVSFLLWCFWTVCVLFLDRCVFFSVVVVVATNLRWGGGGCDGYEMSGVVIRCWRGGVGSGPPVCGWCHVWLAFYGTRFSDCFQICWDLLDSFLSSCWFPNLLRFAGLFVSDWPNPCRCWLFWRQISSWDLSA